MHLKSIELSGFKSFAKKGSLEFTSPISAIVGPNGSGKSNVAEAFRFVLGEQSMKAMRGKRGPDMIWSGNDASPRANRARVAVTFNNRPGRSGDHLLDIDFDEVIVERTVHRDGAHEYAINGSKVRLKDVAALLASANIGGSGHHIISQGEADRILGASERERREMLEEALGLKTYQYKKAESEKKLEKTAENMKEVRSLRRELAPHLNFLNKQMEKRERARELTHELAAQYAVYIAREKYFIRTERDRLQTAEQEPRGKLATVTEELRTVGGAPDTATDTSALDTVDEQLARVAEERARLERSLGRVEGQIALVEKQPDNPNQTGATVAVSRVVSVLRTVTDAIDRALERNDVAELENSRVAIESFRQDIEDTPAQEEAEQNTELHRQLTSEKKEIEDALAEIATREAQLGSEREAALKDVEARRARERESQKRYYELKEEKTALEHVLADVTRDREELARVEEQLENTVSDAAATCGEEVLARANEQSEAEQGVNREAQAKLLRDIERLHARLEEAGTVDEDTVREYEETKKRDAFLERELEDLEASKQSLVEVIAELDRELVTRFEDGLGKVNEQFQRFFAMLFDGGSSKLKLVKKEKSGNHEDEEHEDTKEGIEIGVQLPRKKVTSLDVLSGGERALTSIALIFAMSQVNPPPFLILDETDAALDEANSRKYADMVRALAERSQLILITHNRQTMEAAGELYGVTMGGDGISKVLSVKFDEAVSVAK